MKATQEMHVLASYCESGLKASVLLLRDTEGRKKKGSSYVNERYRRKEEKRKQLS